MNIRDPQKFLETQWDWTPFNSCFGGTAIRISDIDGFVERNGKVLIIETKMPNQIVPKGQCIAFNRFSRIPGFTVLIVWGKPNHPVALQVWGKTGHIPTNNDQLNAYIARWFAMANRVGGAS